jgi:hypothetical protein
MGAWGYSLYADDTTCEVRDKYIDNLQRGQSDAEAVRSILSNYRGLLGNRQVACLVYFALADTQWRYGRLDSKIRQRALKLIEQGGDAAEFDGRKAGAARMKHLLSLKRRLVSRQPARRVVELVASRPKKAAAAGPVGSIYLIQLPRKKLGALVLIGYVEEDGVMQPLFRGLNWCGERLPAAAVLDKHASREPVPFESGLGPCTVVGVLQWDRRRKPLTGLIPTSTVITVNIRFDRCKAAFKDVGGIADDIAAWFRLMRR